MQQAATAAPPQGAADARPPLPGAGQQPQQLQPAGGEAAGGGGLSMLDYTIAGSNSKRVQARELASAGQGGQGAAADEWGNEKLGEDLLPL
jgi:hypothetical protein